MIRYVVITCIIFCITNKVFAQQIKGSLCDEKGNSVAFATIKTTDGNITLSDSLGDFKIVLQPDCFSLGLEISALGYWLYTDTVLNVNTKLKIMLRPKTYMVNEIKVSKTNEKYLQSPVSVIVATKREIENLAPLHIGEVLQTKAGFSQKSGYQSPLTLRGLSGKRLLVLRNGNRRFSSYPSGFMTHTVNVYDLDRIEVEKGAASVIYGGGAIAGIVNLIDKSPFKQKGFNGKLTMGLGTNNNEQNLLACGGWGDEKFSAKIGLRYRTANNFKYADGTVAENSFYKDKDLFVTAGYRLSQNHSLIFTADMHDGGPWGKPVGFNGSKYMRVSTEYEKTNNFSLKYNFKGRKLFKDITVSTFFAKEKRNMLKEYYTAANYQLSYQETTYFSDFYYGIKSTGKIKASNKVFMLGGVEFYSFRISTPMDIIDYIEEYNFSNRISDNARSYTVGAFIQATYYANAKYKFTYGLRYDYANLFEGEVYSLQQEKEQSRNNRALSGNISAHYSPGNNTTFKMNLARSFRMPEISELFTDNYTSNGILYANPTLKPEYCYSADACFNYKKSGFKLEISPFIWLMTDMISRELIYGDPGTNYIYVNIGKTRLLGGEINTSYSLKNFLNQKRELKASIALAYVNGTDVTQIGKYLDNGEPLPYIPPFNAKTAITYSSNKQKAYSVDVTVRSTYYSQQKRLPERAYSTPAYFIFGCATSIRANKLKTKPSVIISVNNLMNKEYYTYLSYLPAQGRMARILLTINI